MVCFKEIMIIFEHLRFRVAREIHQALLSQFSLQRQLYSPKVLLSLNSKSSTNLGELMKVSRVW
jgi:hypothetical protein